MGKSRKRFNQETANHLHPPPREAEVGFARTSTTLKVVQTKNAGKSSSWQLKKNKKTTPDSRQDLKEKYGETHCSGDELLRRGIRICPIRA